MSLIPHPFVVVLGVLGLAYLAGVVAYAARDSRQYRRAMALVHRWLATGQAQPDAPAHLMAATDMPPAMRDGVRGAHDLARATGRTHWLPRARARRHPSEVPSGPVVVHAGAAWGRP